jgi:ankyrin repeat protein
MNRPEIIEMLLKAGADVSIRDRWGRSPLSYACNEDVAKTLLKHVESVKSAAAALAYLNEDDIYERTLLHRIIHERNNRMICFLVGSGADCSDTDMNIQDQIGETPLSYAVQFGQIEAVQRLLEVGASLDIPDSLGMNPIHIAAHRGKLETLHLLFKHGANVEQIGFGGSTPLFYAIMGDHHGLAKILLEEYSANAFTTATGSGKGSLLHTAAHLACAWAVDMLVNEGLDVNTTDAYGKTPLKYAVENDHIMVVIHLILRGAKLYEKTRRWEEAGSPNSTNHLATGLPTNTNHLATGLSNSTNHLATGLSNSTNHLATGLSNSTNHLATGLSNSTNHLATGLSNSTNHLATGLSDSTNHLATGLSDSTNHLATGLSNSTNHLATEIVKTVEP